MIRQESKSARIEIEDREGFIYVPSMNLYVAKERSHLRENWYEAHEALSKADSKMLTIPEFINFLNYLRKNPSGENIQVYEKITQGDQWGAEWLDAYFEKREDGLWILTGNKTKAEKLEKCLMKDRTPGISLNRWLKNPTSQGLPRPKISLGDLYYWYPENGRVAGFLASSFRTDLGCNRDPFFGYLERGVRAVKQP